MSFREGAMGMTLSMDPDTRDAVVGKIVEQGQAFRAVRNTGEKHACALTRISNHAGATRARWQPLVMSTLLIPPAYLTPLYQTSLWTNNTGGSNG